MNLMIKTSLTAMLCLIAYVGANAQGVFEVGNKVCDFGKVKSGETATCVITFTNVGKAKANMGAIRPSGEMMTTDWKSKVLAPGESDSFKVSIDTDGLSGDFKKSVLLIFDRTQDPHTVWITGKIE